MTTTLADLQRRNIAQMEEGIPPVTPSASTEVREYGSTGGMTEASQDGRQDVGPHIHTPPRKAARSSVHQQHGAENFIEVVDAALSSREPLIGGVKATVDMSPALSTRAKRYLADHRGQNMRQILIALFDAFLAAKGY